MNSIPVLRDKFEHHQVIIYFAAVVAAAIISLSISGTSDLKDAINPALALMLFVTFLQVPLADLGQAFTRIRFLGVLLGTNFLVVPLLLVVLIQLLPPDPYA
ncbi:arsenic resistance protein [Xenorhabdus hominickii]|uniref:Arsenic resistance protein n=1 Tax=Xenorhabdus hominickii TaxID=351679 RepID=A0A2G0Q337_XENHO|nr:arsenic resistance protein [Xenorhabdus hominickii]